MPPDNPPIAAEHSAIRARAEARAKDEGVAFRGFLRPTEAWALFKAGEIALVDTRTLAERDLVGYVPGSIVIEWYDYPAKKRNDRFLEQLREKVEPDRPVAFLCRSGVRSKHAATLAAAERLRLRVRCPQWLRGRQERVRTAHRQRLARRRACRGGRTDADSGPTQGANVAAAHRVGRGSPRASRSRGRNIQRLRACRAAGSPRAVLTP